MHYSPLLRQWSMSNSGAPRKVSASRISPPFSIERRGTGRKSGLVEFVLAAFAEQQFCFQMPPLGGVEGLQKGAGFDRLARRLPGDLALDAAGHLVPHLDGVGAFLAQD